jgi:hypothetical protein
MAPAHPSGGLHVPRDGAGTIERKANQMAKEAKQDTKTDAGTTAPTKTRKTIGVTLRMRQTLPLGDGSIAAGEVLAVVQRHPDASMGFVAAAFTNGLVDEIFD